MARKGLFSIKVTSERKLMKSMENAVNTVLKDKVNRINRKGVSILRNAFAEALAGNEKTAKYAANARAMPAESRNLGHPKLGQGLKFKFTDSGLQMRLLFNPNNFNDDIGFWVVYTAQYGRPTLPKRSKSEGPYAMAFKPEDVSAAYSRNGKKKLKTHTRRGSPYVAVYTMGPIAAVAPWFKWKNKLVKNVETGLKDYLRRLK